MLDTTDKTVYPGYGKGYVRDIAIPAFTQRDITMIDATDSVGRSDPQSQFVFHSLSKDGKFLYLYVDEILPQSRHTSLHSINIQSGISRTVIEGAGIQGTGWREATLTASP